MTQYDIVVLHYCSYPLYRLDTGGHTQKTEFNSSKVCLNKHNDVSKHPYIVGVSPKILYQYKSSTAATLFTY